MPYDQSCIPGAFRTFPSPTLQLSLTTPASVSLGLIRSLTSGSGKPNNHTTSDRANRASTMLHGMVDHVVLSIVDAHLYPLLAFVVSFRLESTCNLSLYHLTIALHVGTAGMVTTTLTCLLVPNLGGKEWGTVLRALILFVCFYLNANFVADYRDATAGSMWSDMPA